MSQAYKKDGIFSGIAVGDRGLRLSDSENKTIGTMRFDSSSNTIQAYTGVAAPNGSEWHKMTTPIASSGEPGVIKVGSNMTITSSGQLSSIAEGVSRLNQNVITVSHIAGKADYQTITLAISFINNLTISGNANAPSVTNPFMIVVSPGVYTEQITLPNYVSLQGETSETTTIKSTTGSSTIADSAVIVMGSGSRLERIKLDHTGGNETYAIGIYLSGESDVVISDVVMNINSGSSSAANNGYGIYCLTTSDLRIENLTITIPYGNTNNVFGLYLQATSPKINRLDINLSASGITNGYGIYTYISSDPIITNSRISVTNAGTCYAHYNDESSPELRSVVFLSDTYGLYNTGSDYLASLASSSIVSLTHNTGTTLDTITRATGSFISDGFEVNKEIKLSGASNVGNNNTFLVTAVTATVLTLSNGDFVTTESSGSSITIRQLHTVSIFNSRIKGTTNSIFNSGSTGYFSTHVIHTQLEGGSSDANNSLLTFDDYQTIVVASEGGDFHSLGEALNSISDNSLYRKYQILVRPGLYYETSALTLKSYVKITGSGRDITKVTIDIGSSGISGTSLASSSAFVVGASNVEISDLTFENLHTGSSGYALGFYGSSLSDLLIDRVGIILGLASGAAGTLQNHYGMYLTGTTGFVIDDLKVTVSGGASLNEAIKTYNSTGDFSRTIVTVTGSSSAHNYGFHGDRSNLVVEGSKITVSGSSGSNIAIMTTNTGSTEYCFQIFNSNVVGDDYSLYAADNQIIVATGCRLNGLRFYNTSSGSDSIVRCLACYQITGTIDKTYSAIGLEGETVEITDGSVSIGEGAGNTDSTGTGNTNVGIDAGASNTTGSNNSNYGYQAGTDNTTGSNNTFVGANAGANNTTGSGLTYVGRNAGLNSTTASSSTYLGHGAGQSATTASQNLFMGEFSGNQITTGSDSVFGGYKSGFNGTTASKNVILGSQSARGLTTASGDVIIGYQSGNAVGSGSQSVIIGRSAGNLATTSNNTMIGAYASTLTTTGTEITTLGHQAGYSGTTASYITCLGSKAGYSLTTGSSNFLGGYRAGYSLSTGARNVAIGPATSSNSDSAGHSLTTADDNIFLGKGAGKSTTTGGDNVAQGTDSLNSNITGTKNICLGSSAGASSTSASSNIFIGYYAGSSNTTGDNIAIGTQAGATTTGQYTTFMGTQAGRYLVGNHNMALGVQAGKNQAQGVGSGANNLFVGNYAGYNIQTGNRNVCLGSGTESGGIKGTGASLTSGSDNIIMGYLAAQGMNADSNIIMGTRAGFTATEGDRNVLLGTEAGYNSTTGSQNVYLGYQSGYSTTTGADNFCLGYQSGYSLTTSTRNVFIGTSSGRTTTTGGKSVGIGYQAGYNSNSSGAIFMGYYAGRSNTTGQSNIFIGFQTGMGGIDIDQVSGTPTNLTGDYNVFMGYRAGFTNTTGDRNLLMGYNAGYSNTTGAKNIMMGDNVGYSNTTGSQNIFIGTGAGDSGSGAGYNNTTGNFNLFLGYEAGRSNTTGSYNLALGPDAGRSMTTGIYNICAGYRAGYSVTTSSFNIYMGFDAGYNNTTGEGNIVMGYKAGRSGSSVTTYSNCIILGREAGFGNDASDNVFIGQLAGFKNTTGSNNLCVGSRAGQNNIIGDNNVFIGNLAGQNSTSSSNVCLGYRAGATNTSGDSNICIGANAGFANATGSNNIFLGKGAGQNTTSSQNIFFGAEAGQTNLSGSKNIYFGYRSGKTALGSNNLCIGAETGATLTTGASNVFMGYQSGFNTTTGGSNFFTGYQAGYGNISGNTNIYIGYQAGYTNTTGSRNLAIGYKAMKYSISDVSKNLAIGKFALIGNLYGNSNISIGYDTLALGNVGDNNIVIGPESSSIVRNTGFTRNVSVGFKANFHGFATDNSMIMGPNSLNRGAGGQYNVIMGTGAAPNLGLGTDAYIVASGDTVEAGNNNITIRTNGFVKKGQHISLIKIIDDEAEHETFYVTGISANTVSLSSSLGFSLSVADSIYLTYGEKSTAVLAGTVGNSYITVQTPKTDLETLFTAGDRVTIQDLDTTNKQTSTIISFEINTGTTTTGTTKINLDTTLDYSFTAGDVIFFARERSLLLGELDNSKASANVSIGPESSNSITLGSKCIAIGDRAMFSNVSANYIIAVGTEAAYYAKAPYTTAIGTRAGYSQDFGGTGAGQNTYVGYRAGYFNGFNGPANNNIILGNNAGQINDGCGNIIFANETLDVSSFDAVGSTTYNNKLAIYKSTGGIPSNPIIGGDLELERVGIKTITPKSVLDVAGSMGTAINTFTQDNTSLDYSANYTLYWDKIDTTMRLTNTDRADFLSTSNVLVDKEILHYYASTTTSDGIILGATINHGSFQTVIAHHSNRTRAYHIGAVKFRREISSNVNSSSTALTANSISNFNSSGMISLGSELIHYTGTGRSLGNVTRGRQSTTATTHNSGDKIFYLTSLTTSLNMTALSVTANASQEFLSMDTAVITASNSFILIDSEIIKVIDNTPYLFNVTRGTSNSTATSHLSGATGYVVQNTAGELSETTLASAFTVGDDLIRLTSYSEATTSSGYLIIDSEIIKYDNFSLTGLTRGMSSSTNQGSISADLRVQYLNSSVTTYSTTSTLDGSITSTQTTLTLDDASGFNSSGGIILIESELISHSGKTGNILTGLVRGISSTTLASHDDATTVRKLGSAVTTNGITATSTNSVYIKFASGHSSFTTSGTVLIGTEFIGYTGLMTTGLTPGVGTTDPASHSNSARTLMFANLGQAVSLAAGINDSTTTIGVDANAGYPVDGNIFVGSEVITFSGGSGLDNVVRGGWESTASTHTADADVYYIPSLSSNNTTLEASITANDTTIPSVLNSFMASAGTIAIGSEIIIYSNKNTLDGLTRGYNGSTATSHTINTSDHIYHFSPSEFVTTLSSNMTIGADSIYLTNIAGLPSSGKLHIQSSTSSGNSNMILDSQEIISYSGKNNSLAGLTRGDNSTTAISHSNGEIVYQKIDGTQSSISKTLTVNEDGILIPNPELFSDTGDVQIGNEIISYLTKNQTLSVSERGNMGTTATTHTIGEDVYHVLHNGTPKRIFRAGSGNPMKTTDTSFAINKADLDTSTLDSSGDIRIDGEIVHWRAKNNSLVGKENDGRGFLGSTIANHNSGANVYSIVNGTNAILATSNQISYYNTLNGVSRATFGQVGAVQGDTLYYFSSISSPYNNYYITNIDINDSQTTITDLTKYIGFTASTSGYAYIQDMTESEWIHYTAVTETSGSWLLTGITRGQLGTSASSFTGTPSAITIYSPSTAVNGTFTANTISGSSGNGQTVYINNGTLNFSQITSSGSMLTDSGEVFTYTEKLSVVVGNYYAPTTFNSTFTESIIYAAPNVSDIDASGDILIDQEIIHYNKKGNTLNGVARAGHSSTKIAHLSGARVNLVAQGSVLTLNPDNTDTLTVSGDFIPFASGTSLSSSGYVRINQEIVHYSRTNSTLSSLTRAQNGSSAATHTSGSQVYEMVIGSGSSTIQTAHTTDASDNKVINLADVSNYDSSGDVLIDSEIIHYNFKGKSLTNLTRGVSITSSLSHTTGDTVYKLVDGSGNQLPYSTSIAYTSLSATTNSSQTFISCNTSNTIPTGYLLINRESDGAKEIISYTSNATTIYGVTRSMDGTTAATSTTSGSTLVYISDHTAEIPTGNLITQLPYPYLLINCTREINGTSEGSVSVDDNIIYFSSQSNNFSIPSESSFLTSLITDSTSTIILDDNVSGSWSSSGYICIESEMIHYSSISSNILNNCSRGDLSTTAASHTGGVQVYVSNINPPKLMTMKSLPAASSGGGVNQTITFTGNESNISSAGTIFADGELITYQSADLNSYKLEFNPYNYQVKGVIRGAAGAQDTIAKGTKAWHVSNSVSVTSVTLDGAINDSVTNINMSSIPSGFSTVGYVSIEGEIIAYNSTSGTYIKNCTRGFDFSTAASHTSGDIVIFTDHIYQIYLEQTSDSATTINYYPGNSNIFLMSSSGSVVLVNDSSYEKITYTSLDISSCGNILSGVTRGANGTTSASHSVMDIANYISNSSNGAFQKTTLAQNATSDTATIYLDSLTGFLLDGPGLSGYALLNSEIIHYAEVSGGLTALTGVTRAKSYTTADSHTTGDSIRRLHAIPKPILSSTVNSSAEKILVDMAITDGYNYQFTSSGAFVIDSEIITYKKLQGYNVSTFNNSIYSCHNSEVWTNITKNVISSVSDVWAIPKVRTDISESNYPLRPILCGRGLSRADNFVGPFVIDSYNTGSNVHLSGAGASQEINNFRRGGGFAFLLDNGGAGGSLGNIGAIMKYESISGTYLINVSYIIAFVGLNNFEDAFSTANRVYYCKFSDAILDPSSFDMRVYTNYKIDYDLSDNVYVGISDDELSDVPLYAGILYIYPGQFGSHVDSYLQTNSIIEYSQVTRNNATPEHHGISNDVLLISSISPVSNTVGTHSSSVKNIVINYTNTFNTSGKILITTSGEIIRYDRGIGINGVTRGQLSTTALDLVQDDPISIISLGSSSSLTYDLGTDSGTSSYLTLDDASGFNSGGLVLIPSASANPEIIGYFGKNSLNTLTRDYVGTTIATHDIGDTAYRLTTLTNHSTLRKDVGAGAGANLPLADATNYNVSGFVLIDTEIIKYDLKNSIDDLSGNQYNTESFTTTTGSLKPVTAVTGHSTLRTNISTSDADTRIHLTDGSNYGTSGLVIIDGEMIIYNTRNSIDTLSRAQYGTTAATHNTINGTFLTSVTAHSTLDYDITTSSQGILPLVSGALYPSSGYVLVDTEYFHYQNKNSLDNLQRGQYGTATATHSNASIYTTSGYTVQQLTSVTINSTLRSSMGVADKGVSLNSTANFTSSGYALIDSEFIYYTNYKSLDTLTRGNYGTTTAVHSSGAGINQVTMNGYSTLRSNIVATETTIPLTDASSYLSSGLVIIDGEYINYTNKNTIDGLTRGLEGTTTTPHNHGGNQYSIVYDVTTPSVTANSGLILSDTIFLSDDTTGIQLASGVDNFPNSGTITIGSEKIAFASKKGLTYLTRATNNTTATIHNNGTTVYVISDFVSTSTTLNADSLSSDISAAATVIPLNSTANFAGSGTVIIGSELITYNSKVGSNLTDCQRGRFETSASAYSSGQKVIRSNAVAIKSTITQEMDATQRMLILANSSSFPSSGTILIDSEVILYENKRAITTLTRGSDSTIADGYPNGTSVTLTDITLDDDHYTVLGNTDTGDLEFDLPPAASVTGRQYIIKKVTSGGGGIGDLIINPNASETIDGATTKTTSTDYAFIKIQSDGSNWHIINYSLAAHWT